MLPFASRIRPDADEPASVPSSTMIGVPAYPGCDVPSRITGSVIAGRAVSGEIVHTPSLKPGSLAGISKVISVRLAAASAAAIAWRKLPGPESAVVVTTPDGVEKRYRTVGP